MERKEQFPGQGKGPVKRSVFDQPRKVVSGMVYSGAIIGMLVISLAFSVTVAVLLRNFLLPLFGKPVGAYFSTFSFAEADLLAPAFYGYVLLSALLVALAGVGFYFALFALKKLFGKLKFRKGTGKFLLPFLLAGAATALYLMLRIRRYLNELEYHVFCEQPLFAQPQQGVLSRIQERFAGAERESAQRRTLREEDDQ